MTNRGLFLVAVLILSQAYQSFGGRRRGSFWSGSAAALSLDKEQDESSAMRAAAGSDERGDNSAEGNRDDPKSSESSSWLDGFELEDPPLATMNRPYDHDDDDDDDDLNEGNFGLDYLQLHPLLQIPCSLSIGSDRGGTDERSPLTTVLDTGAQRTVMSWKAAKTAGLLLHMDKRYAGGKAQGVSGSCAVLGRIPAGVCRMHLGGAISVPCPAIYVFENDDYETVEFLIGLDCLRELRAVINLRDEELQISSADDQVATVAFIRPRGRMMAGTGTRPNCRPTNILASCKTEGNSESDEDANSEDDQSIDMSGV